MTSLKLNAYFVMNDFQIVINWSNMEKEIMVVVAMFYYNERNDPELKIEIKSFTIVQNKSHIDWIEPQPLRH